MDIDISTMINRKLKILQSDLNKIALSKLPTVLKETMQQSIKESIYDKPSSWDRTWSFFNSVDSNTKINGNIISVSVFSNSSKMNPSHYSVVGSESYGLSAGDVVDNYMNSWLANGHGGLWDYSPLHNYVDFTYSMLISNKIHVKTVKNSLKQYGYTII